MFQNRLTLIGFLGQPAEPRTTPNGTPYTVLSLATNRSWLDRSTGKRLTRTTWHRCLVWGKLATLAADLPKGAHLHIEGELLIRDFTQVIPAPTPLTIRRFVAEVRVMGFRRLTRTQQAEAAEPEVAA